MNRHASVTPLFVASILLATTACAPPETDDIAKAEAVPNGPTLSVTADNEELLVPLREGARITTADASFIVEAIRPWSGLIRTGGGLPMAAVSVQANGDRWLENVFLADGVWTTFADRVSFVLQWHESNDEARAAADEPYDPVAGARWGVRDGGQIQWLNTFEPGSGVELQDGTDVTLVALGREGERPALEVAVQRDGAETRAIVTPGDSADWLVRFEVPGLSDYVVRLHAWRDGAAYVHVHRHGEAPLAPKELRAGETWARQDGAFAIRLEQVMRGAAAVTPEDSTIREVVLQRGAERIRVREGEAVRYGDALLRIHAPE